MTMMAEDIREILSCPICLEEYNEPKALRCLHTFCKTCLQGLVKKYLECSGQSDIFFACPVCRQKCEDFDKDSPDKWIKELPSNHLIVSFKDKMNIGISQNEDKNMCLNHKKVLEFFCEDHMNVLCSKCTMQKHRQCNSIVDIEQAWQIDDREYGELLDNIDQNINMAYEMISERTQQKEHLEIQSAIVCQNMGEFRENVIRTVLEMECKLNEEVNRIKENGMEQLHYLQEETQSKIQELTTKKKKIEKLRNQSKCCPNISSYRDMNKEVQYIRKELEQNKYTVKSNIKYHENTDLLMYLGENGIGNLTTEDCIIETEKGLGNLSDRTYEIETPLSEKSRKSRQKKANTKLRTLNPEAKAFLPQIQKFPKLKFQKDITINSPKDKFPCYITGATFLSDSSLILSDHDNGKVKVFDLDYNLRTEMGFNSDPWDVTAVTETQIAITFPDDNLIQFLIFQRNRLICGRGILRTDGRCYGLSSFQDELAVCIRKKAESFVVVFKISTGETLLTWSSGQESVTSGIWYNAFDISGQHIYIADENNGFVKCISRTLTDVRTIKAQARAVVVYDRFIFVGCNKSHQIKCIPKEDREVPAASLEIGTYPDIIALDANTGRLLITEVEGNITKKVRIFEM